MTGSAPLPPQIPEPMSPVAEMPRLPGMNVSSDEIGSPVPAERLTGPEEDGLKRQLSDPLMATSTPQCAHAADAQTTLEDEQAPKSPTSPQLRRPSREKPQSSVAIRDFLQYYAEELHLKDETATGISQQLATDELLRTTEDLYNLGDRETIMRLGLPLHIRRWLADERQGLLFDPRAYMVEEAVRRSRRANHPLHTSASNTCEFDSLPDVEVTMQINSVTAVDIQQISFDVDFTLMLDWIDRATVGLTADEIKHGEFFSPEVVIDNALDTDQPVVGDRSTRVNKLVDGICQDGHMKKTCRYRVSLTCPELDLRAFPFDTQALPIRLKARAHRSLGKQVGGVTTDMPVVLVGPEGRHGTQASDGLRGVGHKVLGQADLLAEFSIQSLMGICSEQPDRWYELKIIVEREPGHAMQNVSFPCFVIMLFSFTVFVIPMSDLGSRLENTATCLLAMMAFQGAIKDMLPPVNYQTALGRYVTAVYLILLVHGFEHAFFFLMTSDEASAGASNKPADFFFGSVKYFDPIDEKVPKVEAVWIVTEFLLVMVLHIVYVVYFRWLKKKGKEKRLREGQRRGVSLVHAVDCKALANATGDWRKKRQSLTQTLGDRSKNSMCSTSFGSSDSVKK
eukprot:TRINITY_DN36467_c0_g1_i1.p1 TRINITY_DN36467_c0_g1~~TRINITY_DN36467_c0_g1_i1.p1  ORF type:complete len:641 (+),score=116.20 TRINITY_DN36467_c0_g1_i1:56-1924(+)